MIEIVTTGYMCIMHILFSCCYNNYFYFNIFSVVIVGFSENRFIFNESVVNVSVEIKIDRVFVTPFTVHIQSGTKLRIHICRYCIRYTVHV